MENTTNIFEKASRQRLRFRVARGVIAVEDLWSLPFQELNTAYKGVCAEMRGSEDSLFTEKPTDGDLELRRDLLKHVYTVRVAEQAEQVKSAERKLQIQRLEQLIFEKGQTAMAAKSVEELQALLADLKK